MAGNPFSPHWREDEFDRGVVPADWIACDCPRCGRGIYAPENLVGKLLCTSCLPVCRVLLVKHAEYLRDFASEGQQDGERPAES